MVITMRLSAHRKPDEGTIEGIFRRNPEEARKHLTFGGGAGIRTLDASFSSHTPLAGEPLQPLGHASKPRRQFSMGRGELPN